MAKPIPLDEVIDQENEKLLLHASKAKLIKLEKFTHALLNAGQQRNRQRITYNGELFITDKSITLARWEGLFKKRIMIPLFAEYDPQHAEDTILVNALANKELMSKMKAEYASLSAWDRLKTAYNIGPGRQISKKYSELFSKRLRALYLTTNVAGGKGIFRKGFDVRLVRFDMGPGLGYAARGGITGGLLNWALKPRESEYIWKLRIIKLAPEYNGFLEGAMDGIVQNMAVGADQLNLKMESLWEIAKAVYTA